MEGEGSSTVRGGTACQWEERGDYKKEDSKTQRVERWKCAPPGRQINWEIGNDMYTLLHITIHYYTHTIQ